ncbi:MAG: coiled coil domain-containing protein [Acinetobacter sp.]|nr:coiled coil domain-containing protein [Acinetobacter sp.]MDO9621184.1 hypothetical protein [Moraxellaceae bacterium]
MIDKDLLQQKLQAQINEWKAQADLLKAKAESAGVDAKAEAHQQLEKLKTLQAEAQAKFDELKSVGEEKFGEVKAKVEGLVEEAGSALKSLTDRLK